MCLETHLPMATAGRQVWANNVAWGSTYSAQVSTQLIKPAPCSLLPDHQIYLQIVFHIHIYYVPDY